MPDRKPLILLGVLALLAIALYLFGFVGAGRDGDADPWPEWAAPGFAAGDQLRPSDLRGSASCGFDGTEITFSGSCRVDVVEVAGGLPWQAATRRATLTVVGQPVALQVTLAGKELRTDLDPGDRVRLTYTREGGRLSLGCGSPTGCMVVLSEDG